LLCQLKPDWAAGLPLTNGSAIEGIAIGGNVIDLDGDNVAPAKFAVDCKIKQRQIRVCFSIWSKVRMAQTCLGLSGGLAPISLPLFHGTRLVAGTAKCSVSRMIALLCYEGEEDALLARRRLMRPQSGE
jgi:hypothetical protein